jgi:hypothetical protein
MRFSAYDLQLNKICDVNNKRTASAVIKAIKRIASADENISNMSDNEIFKGWRYVLIAHNKYFIPNNRITLKEMKFIDDYEIILPNDVIF